MDPIRSRLLALQGPEGGLPAVGGAPPDTESTALGGLALGEAAPRAQGRALAWLRVRQRPDGAWPLEAVLRERRVRYVDLNWDATRPVRLRSRFSELGRLHLPRTVLDADLLVSMPKMKTHHWAGVPLSMKNLFGIVPGAIYGWPKNTLHWAGSRRASSI